MPIGGHFHCRLILEGSARKGVKKMSPLLLQLMIYPLIGFLEWFLALKRTQACISKQKTLLVTIVFIENLLGLLVLQNFIVSGDWVIAVCYSIGGALGALLSLNNISPK